MQNEFSIAEAKNKLPAIIHRVENGPEIKLTRRGKPVAVLLSIKEYDRLNDKGAGFREALLKFRESIKEESIDINDSDFDNLRDTDAGRKVEFE
ncbi:MAG: type II toxin-antitoxin system prevent-host-death family antitoxin [Desulfobacteraceae bacterium]|jgi:prevent-host-death family protein